MTTITIDRAIVEQALEALEWHYRQGHSNTLGGFRLKIDEKALRALRAALAQQTEPRNQCRSDGRCQYAIDHGAEGMGHCPKGKCVMAQHTQPAEDRDVAQSNLRVMKEMFREQAEPAQQDEPVKHQHKWFRTGAMEPGQMRCIDCGEWGKEQAEPLNLADPAVQKRLAAQWGYVPAAAQAEPVQEPVAWVASKDGRVIYDDASTDDGLLRVSGDFENDEQRSRYAQRIVDKLNAALAQQAEPVQVAERERVASQWDGCVTHQLDTFGPVDIGASIRAGELVEAQQAEPVESTPFDWPRKACPCRDVQHGECLTAGCKWERDPSLVPQHLRQPPTQAQQAEPVEPVAWECKAGGLKPLTQRQYDAQTAATKRHYTRIAPPPRTMVPLTEEEIYHATRHCGVSRYTAINIARAVELAHGIEE